MSFGSGLYSGGPFGGTALDGVAPSQGFGSGLYGSNPYGIIAGPFGTDEPLTADYFILAEDDALKAALKGLVVADENNNTRPVGVYFSQPDPEVRAQKYPYITIDLIDVIENKPQVQSTYGPLDGGNFDYFQNLPQFDANNYGIGQYYLSPMLLVYQISTWSRHPRHDRAILSKLNHGCLHPRFGQLTVPTDGTVRRLVVTSFAKRDTTDDKSKRLFRNIWTIQIPSEIFYDAVDLTARAQSVIINDGTLPKSPPATMANPIIYPA